MKNDRVDRIKARLRSSWWLHAAGILLTMLVVAGCTQASPDSAQGQATPTPLPTPIVLEKPTYLVQRGTVIKTLEFTGRVSPVTEQELFFRTDGFVTDIFVARGDMVAAGEILAQLDIDDLENQLADARLNLQTAETQLAQAEQKNADDLIDAQTELENKQLQRQQQQLDTSTGTSVAEAQINLSRAEQTEADAEREYNEALERSWETDEVRDNYKRQWDRAQEDLRVAQLRYRDALNASTSRSVDTDLVDAEIAQIELRIERLSRGVDPLLALDVEKAQLQVTELEGKIANARLTAPFEGQVLSLSIQAGDGVQAFDGVLVLADPTELEISADLNADDLAELSVGQPANLTLRNRPEDDLSGSVRQLPASFSGSNVSSDDDDSVRVTIDSPPAGLDIGELANVTIILEERDDVLWVNPSAIRTFQGRNFVVVEDDDGNRRRVDVQLGIESADRVELLEGANAGELIIGE
jgi:multidrug efflux pump subunit AcrA (membrane-fusion protein)